MQMSKNRNRAKLNKAINNHEYNRKHLRWLYPPYYEEGWNWHGRNISNRKWREFKTWKHNRTTQYKHET